MHPYLGNTIVFLKEVVKVLFATVGILCGIAPILILIYATSNLSQHCTNEPIPTLKLVRNLDALSVSRPRPCRAFVRHLKAIVALVGGAFFSIGGSPTILGFGAITILTKDFLVFAIFVRGIVVGFHSDALQEFAPNGWLTGVAYTWGPLFTRIVNSIGDGTWKSEHIRGGVETDYVTLAPFGPSVSDETKAQIEEAKAKLISGELKIFQGPILDNKGETRIPEGEAGGMELLDTTDWLVEGVVGQTE